MFSLRRLPDLREHLLLVEDNKRWENEDVDELFN